MVRLLPDRLRRRDPRRDPALRSVRADEPVLARWGVLQEEARPTGNVEYWVLDGQDGRPLGAGRLQAVEGQPGVGELWIFVDPVVRHFGAGQKLWIWLEVRARQRGLTTITSHASDVDGATFMSWHAFEPTHDETMPDGGLRAHGRLELE